MIKASHLLLAIFGFGALLSYAPIPGIIILVSNCIIWNLLRCWWQNVGIHGLDFWYNKSTMTSFFTIPFLSVIGYIALMAAPIFQFNGQYLLGCVPLTYSWISSLLIMIPSLFVLIDSTVMRIMFGVVLLIYLIFLIIFFKSINEPWYKYLFTRKPSNWKECLRGELWDNPYHCAHCWGIPELIGDDDANHAYHSMHFRECFLPLDKLEKWLLEKKESFLISPPLWMTVDWFTNLPPKLKKHVWKEPGELERLVDKVTQVTQHVAAGT